MVGWKKPPKWKFSIWYVPVCHMNTRAYHIAHNVYKIAESHHKRCIPRLAIESNSIDENPSKISKSWCIAVDEITQAHGTNRQLKDKITKLFAVQSSKRIKVWQLTLRLNPEFIVFNSKFKASPIKWQLCQKQTKKYLVYRKSATEAAKYWVSACVYLRVSIGINWSHTGWNEL